MTNLRSFSVNYVPWTNTKPARVRIYDNRNNVYLFIPYFSNEGEDNDRVENIAHQYLRTKGIECSYLSQNKKGFLLLTHNFETQIK